MREIKYRAKEIATGEWVVGSLKPINYESSLAVFFANVQVGKFDIETVGQYIDKKDKNGVEIYEKDVVKLNHSSPEYDHPYWNGVVEYLVSNYRSAFWVHSLSRYHINDWSIYPNTEVIGNTIDNPELLEI